MTQNASPPMLNLVPESAPFSEEQRAWLNGFLAGFISLDGATPVTNEQVAALMAGGPAGAAAEEDDGGAPWHDQTLPIDDRMKLADGKPVRWRLMAAMAQQDCGQCGYDCRNYSSAIFEGKEERLNLCVPGGKATARMVKALHAEMGSAPAKPAAATVASAESAATPAPAAPAGTRDNPVTATLVARTCLNKDGSEKETWHIEYDIADSGLDYVVGDSFGLFPSNDPELVRDIIAALGGEANFPIGGRTLREVLLDGVSLAPAPDMLFQLYSYITGGERRRKAQALAAGEDPDGDAETLDVLAAIEKFPGVRPDPEAFIEALDPLQPRLYSIASSPKAHRGRIALTVDAVRYVIDTRQRLGVASTFVGGRAPLGHSTRVYIQKANDFRTAARPGEADHHDRTGHRRRPVPRLPARTPGDASARAQLAIFRPSAQQL